MANKIQQLTEKQEQLQKELRIVTDELNLLKSKGIRRAEEVYLQVKKTDFLEKVQIIRNKNNPQECRVYALYDLGGYNGRRFYHKTIENCSKEDYELLTSLPYCIGIKDTEHYNLKSEIGLYTTELFLEI